MNISPWIGLLCSALMLGVLCLLWYKRRATWRKAAGPNSSRGRVHPRYEIHITRQNKAILPAGYDRGAPAGLFPMSQVLAMALQGLPSYPGLYSVTFSPETLTALRSGDAALMHSPKGDRAVAVRVNGTVKELGTVTTPCFDVGAACLATASLVTGQYFLVRIDQKLNAILSGVDHILEFLDSTERAELTNATAYLRTLLANERKAGLSESVAIEVRHHRTRCMTIATRNLEVLEQKLVQRNSRNPLGPKEILAARWVQASRWVDNQVSRAIPSRREEHLIAESREFAITISRGLMALQAVLCFEALLEEEPSSPYALEACSMAKRYGIARGKILDGFALKEGVALNDCRYFDAEKKTARFQQELAARVAPVDVYWKLLIEMVDLWQARMYSVPEMLFVSVDDSGKPLKVFLPIP